MLLAVAAIFIAGLLAPYLHMALKKNTVYLLALVPLSVFVYFATFIPEIAAGETVRQSTPWVSLFDVNLSFYLDGLSLLFGLIVTGIGTFIILYGGGYLEKDRQLPRFYSAILIFMGSMVGLVIADNLLSLFVFWELTSFSSYILIGYYHEKEESRKSALQALLITGIGGLAMLAGLILMGFVSGTFEISEMLGMGDIFRESPMYTAILILVLAGAFTKSAQFPFHFWLPGAMAAPTPVSAYLHSATMVKAGVFLLMRLNPALGSTDLWFGLLTGFGAFTLLMSAWLALRFTDLKQILAYTTVMALSTLTMLIGIGTEYAMKAAAVFVLGHSLYKGALFMVAGAVDHEAGTRDVRKLGGLRKLMPITAGAAIIAALSMAGIPPLFGFIGKELVYEAALSIPDVAIILIVIAVLANVAVVAASCIVVLRPFFGKEVETPKHAHEAPWLMWIGPAFLAGLSLIFGLLPFLIDSAIIKHTASAIAGYEIDFYLALWHGINLPLILSIVTVLLGVGVYFIWDKFQDSKGMQGYGTLFAIFPKKTYEALVDGLLKLAAWQTGILQNGYLRYYLLTITVVMLAAVGGTFFLKADMAWYPDFSGILFYEYAIVGVMLVALLFAVSIRSRLTIVISLGILGFSLALIYILHGAADLAMTQILVETLTVILVALVLIHMPTLSKEAEMSNSGKIRDAIIAVSAGTLVTMLVLATLHLPFDDFISQYYASVSYSEAYGRNIVNVILVDFRALDTMGEVVVVAVAGIAVYALIKMKGIFNTKEEGSR